jgi:hypothetical protein
MGWKSHKKWFFPEKKKGHVVVHTTHVHVWGIMYVLKEFVRFLWPNSAGGAIDKTVDMKGSFVRKHPS